MSANYAEKYAAQIEPSTEARQPQVGEALSHLERLVEQHVKTVAEMEQKLGPVLRNEPVAAGSGSKDPASAVPLASRICESVSRLSKALDDYQSIIRRLEV